MNNLREYNNCTVLWDTDFENTTFGFVYQSDEETWVAVICASNAAPLRRNLYISDSKQDAIEWLKRSLEYPEKP